jgi:hypothetical protein
MKYKDKTKKQLINELMEFRQWMAEWEAYEADHTRVDEELPKWRN